MRLISSCLLAVSLLCGSLIAPALADEPNEPLDLTIVSFNVLVSASKVEGIPAWDDRKDLSVQSLKATDADVIGLQETLPKQLQFFLDELKVYDAHFYKSYPDAALLWHRDRFEPLEKGHWWLSPTPDRVSTGFGNALPRLVVWAKLRHLASGQEVYVFNTHFDNSLPSQIRMAELSQEKLAVFAEEKLPMFFIGDFNTHQTRGNYELLVSNGWQDSYVVSEHASPDGRDENVITFPGVGRIDHIFYHGPGLTPQLWERLESPDPAKRLSDHYGIMAKFQYEAETKAEN